MVIDSNESVFDEIRPYYDHEVRPALDRLIEDDDFIASIINLRVKRRTKLMKALAYPFVRQRMRRMLKGISDIKGVQILVKDYVDRMLDSSCSGLSISGMEDLPVDQAYLFISNHRDIVLDPALVNYALLTHGHDTVRIAIGDNLQSSAFISDLMRLNKSFTVKRSVKRPRERLMAYKTLSNYIYHSLKNDQNSVWIAQSEGRAKDGIDITQAAIIKMISMSRNKKIEFSEFINDLSIVPVSISYEYDPCDEEKARELYIREKMGSYKKSENEDFKNISKGIKGQKGRIHLSFGKPLKGSYETPEEVAKAVDEQVISNYHVFPNNLIAYNKISENIKSFGSEIELAEHDIRLFNNRMNNIDPDHRPYAFKMYGNIIALKEKMRKTESC